MPAPKNYRLSFTAASLMVPEMIRMARCIVLDNVPLEDMTPEVLGRARSETGKREFLELSLRLRKLAEPELKLLAESTPEDQRHICLLAFARTYPFFMGFLTEVILEKVAVYDFLLTDTDYNAYVSRKSVEHPELANISDSTKGKIRQVTLKVLAQAGLTDESTKRNINILFASESLRKVLADNNPQDLKLFSTF
jgi:hypothetical protein